MSQRLALRFGVQYADVIRTDTPTTSGIGVLCGLNENEEALSEPDLGFADLLDRNYSGSVYIQK